MSKIKKGIMYVVVFVVVFMVMAWLFRVEVNDVPNEYDVTYYENVVTLDELAKVEE